MSRPWPGAFVVLTVLIATLGCGSSGVVQSSARDWQADRIRMVDEQLSARDIRSA
jgi:hypothetical protein